MKTRTQKLFSILLITLSLATGLAGLTTANAGSGQLLIERTVI